MKISKARLKEIILEECIKLDENIDDPLQEKQTQEHNIARLVYLLLGKARQTIEEYLGELGENEEPSQDFSILFEAVSAAWLVADKMLTGGETHDALPELFEGNSDCTEEEISNALEIVSRCVMRGKTGRPKSTETELGVMPKRVSAPPAGVKAGGIKWVDEGKKNEQ